MKLTVKDKEFIERLKELSDQDKVWIERAAHSPGHFILRGNYGDHIDEAFRMTRQGVRWRFWRLFNDIYISAYETIIFIERNFGAELRKDAIDIARQLFILRQRARENTVFKGADSYSNTNED